MTVPIDLDVRMKGLVLAAVFLIVSFSFVKSYTINSCLFSL